MDNAGVILPIAAAVRQSRASRPDDNAPIERPCDDEVQKQSRTSVSDNNVPKERNVDHFWYMIQSKNLCNMCKRNYDDPATHRAHEPCFRKTRFFKPRQNREKQYTCCFCKSGFPKLNKLRLHLYGHFDYKFVCKICKAKKSNPRTIRDHILIVHGQRTATSSSDKAFNVLRDMPAPKVDNIRSNKVTYKSANSRKAMDYKKEVKETGVQMLDYGTFIPQAISVSDFCII
jgi:hypothetical protein